MDEMIAVSSAALFALEVVESFSLPSVACPSSEVFRKVAELKNVKIVDGGDLLIDPEGASLEDPAILNNLKPESRAIVFLREDHLSSDFNFYPGIHRNSLRVEFRRYAGPLHPDAADVAMRLSGLA